MILFSISLHFQECAILSWTAQHKKTSHSLTHRIAKRYAVPQHELAIAMRSIFIHTLAPDRQVSVVFFSMTGGTDYVIKLHGTSHIHTYTICMQPFDKLHWNLSHIIFHRLYLAKTASTVYFVCFNCMNGGNNAHGNWLNAPHNAPRCWWNGDCSCGGNYDSALNACAQKGACTGDVWPVLFVCLLAACVCSIVVETTYRELWAFWSQRLACALCSRWPRPFGVRCVLVLMLWN